MQAGHNQIVDFARSISGWNTFAFNLSTLPLRTDLQKVLAANLSFLVQPRQWDAFNVP